MSQQTAPITPSALRLLANMLRAAEDMVRAGTAAAADIDLAMCSGVRHPVGPVMLAHALDTATRRELRLDAQPPSLTASTAGDTESIAGPAAPYRPGAGTPWSDAPIGVVGTGFMASGIAYAVAAAGQHVVVLGRSAEATQSTREAVARALGVAAERDRLGGQSVEGILERISTAVHVSALEVCRLVIEAVTEDLSIKRSVFSQLDQALPEAELLATNTSSLRVGDIAAALGRPERVGALHFFSPVPAMKLVEVVGHERVPDLLLLQAAAWARSIGKVPVRCADRAGFIVNSLLIPFLNDTVRAGTEGGSTPAELDRLLVAEAGHPMGPFQLLDFIGLDVSLAAQRALFTAEPGNERLRPADALVQHVEAGRLGRKSGRGFYDYESVPVTI